MKFTVITVCLNSMQTIEKTIQSVIEQENADLEYIIVDGGSEDGTLDIIKRYEDRIAQYISEPDQGLYDAMNKGIRMATGDVVSFLNSSDWYEDGIFPLIEDAFIQSPCDIVAGRQALIGENGIVGYSAKEREESGLYINMIYSHPALFARRDLFIKYGGFDIQYKVCADYEWTLRVYNQGAQIKCIDLVTTNFTLGGISSGRECIEERRDISIKHLPEDLKGQYTDKIIELYQTCTDIFYFESEIKLLRKSHDRCDRLRQVLNEKLHWSESCHLFGTGVRASQCMDLLEALNIDVEHVYDNNEAKQGTEYRGKIVEKPVVTEEGNTWIITSTFYEDEIREQLDAMGVKQYVAFSDMIHIVSEFAVREGII